MGCCCGPANTNALSEINEQAKKKQIRKILPEPTEEDNRSIASKKRDFQI
jgi:hypothetical protein